MAGSRRKKWGEEKVVQPARTAARAEATAPPPATGTAAVLLRAQRLQGNRFVQRLIARSSAGSAAGGEVPEETAQEIESARSGGRALDGGTRERMESAFGADFSGVRVHTGATADRLNGELSARAFTTGSDIFFRHGEYDPGRSSGRELLAHELTHVVQQGGAGAGAVQGKLTVGAADHPAEREADAAAAAVVAREMASDEEKEKDKEKK